MEEGYKIEFEIVFEVIIEFLEGLVCDNNKIWSDFKWRSSFNVNNIPEMEIIRSRLDNIDGDREQVILGKYLNLALDEVEILDKLSDLMGRFNRNKEEKINL